MSDIKTLVRSKRAILFDMDGTLVNTERLHAMAAAGVLSDLGAHIDVDECLSRFYGMTDTHVLQTLCPQLNNLEIEKAIDEKNRRLIIIFKNLNEEEKNQYITPGLFSFLEALKKAKKKCAVVSASEDIVVTETLKAFKLDRWVELQMGRNQTSLTKPHPDPYLEAMKRLDVNANESLIFEDSPTGIKAALASQAEVVRITMFAHDSNAQKISGPYIELKNFIDLHAL